MGKFVVIEGLDGVGKSTLISKVLYKLKIGTVSTLYVPTSSLIGREVNALVKGIYNSRLPCSNASLYLFLAVIEQCLEDIVIPDMKEGRTVISDRWWPSTYAYQGVDIDRNFILNLCLSMPVQPDLYIRIDIPEEERLRRKGTTKLDLIESKGETFYQKVLDNYMELEGLLPQVLPSSKVHVLKGSSIEDLYDQVINLVRE